MRTAGRLFGVAVSMMVMAGVWAGSARARLSQSCRVDDEDIPLLVPACALIQRQGEQYLASKYLNSSRLDFNSHGLAWLHLVDSGFVYVNRTGRIVIRDVSMMDNGADEFHHGLVRLQRGEKYGFADPKGRIVIPVHYDGAMNTDEDGASVCVGCKVQQSGEHSFFTAGQWFAVDARGRLRAER